MNEYDSFLASKAALAPMRGLRDIPPLSSHLRPLQRLAVGHNLLVGGAGCFLDTGLGKTLCQHEYCEHARNATNGWALLFTPMAVAQQIHREGQKFGYPTRVVRDQSECREGINIANYERLHLFDPSAFGVVSLDESAIIANFGGVTSKALIYAFASHRFKLSASATPAANDHMELGQHSEFCGIMASNEMLSRFFINDTSTASQKWRLKHHAVQPFWDWMASWARMAQMPSDMGCSDDGYELPPLKIIKHSSTGPAPSVSGGLFGDAVSATSMHDVKRQTSAGRAAQCAELVTSDCEPWAIWVDTDYEADAVRKALRGLDSFAEVRGSMSIEEKERNIMAFSDGALRVLLTKSSITGQGLNWQHCARTFFVGRTFSYRNWYQAVRRFWRVGQQREVQVHIAVAEGEETIGLVIDRKAADHAAMKAAMRLAMQRDHGRESRVKVAYNPQHKASMPSWLIA